MYSSLETTTNGGVELPWNVSGAEDQDTLTVSSYTILDCDSVSFVHVRVMYVVCFLPFAQEVLS